MVKKVILSLAAIFLKLATFAQGGNKVEMADAMHANGKIYVVVAVILTIFAGIIIYLVRLDRKISRIEKNNF